MALQEDLSLFFRDFADQATLAGRSVAGIVLSAADTVNLGGMAIVAADLSMLLPAASVQTSDTDAALVIATGYHAGSYTVRRIEPHDTGLKLLTIERIRP